MVDLHLYRHESNSIACKVNRYIQWGIAPDHHTLPLRLHPVEKHLFLKKDDLTIIGLSKRVHLLGFDGGSAMSLSSNIGVVVGEREIGRLCSGMNGSVREIAASLSDGNEGAWEIGVTGGRPSAGVSTD
jgi:hypothetical protein